MLDKLTYIGLLTDKTTRTYDRQDGTKGTAYNLEFKYMGGYAQINCNDETFNKLKEGSTYALPVGASSSTNSDRVRFYVRNKDATILEITEDGSFEEVK